MWEISHKMGLIVDYSRPKKARKEFSFYHKP